MKLHLRNIVLTAGLSALLGSIALSAQDKREVANITFTYQAGQQTLPAGKYMVQETATRGLFKLSDRATSQAIFVAAVPQDTGRNADSKLTFSCVGSQCSLSQIWIDGDSYQVRQPKVEREAKNQIGVVALVSVPLLSR
jgi:hypothetical protein